jgi:hypothetical protein
MTETVVVPVSADTWIDEARQTSQHGGEETFFVSGAIEERRALLAFSIPDPGSRVVARAVLVLELVANHDLTRAERTLRVFPLSGTFDEASASWRRRQSSGGNDARWLTDGGDVGEESAPAVLPEGTAAGRLTFDVTALMAASEPSADPLALLVLESSAPPAAPAELEFGARESPGESASLELEYCEP